MVQGIAWFHHEVVVKAALSGLGLHLGQGVAHPGSSGEVVWGALVNQLFAGRDLTFVNGQVVLGV